MWLRSEDFENNGPIPGDNALAVIRPETRVTFSANRNPHLEWGDVPDGVESFALVVTDRDVPGTDTDVNRDDREVPAETPRIDFTHWVLVDIDPDTRSIDNGAFSDGVTPHGKEGLSGRPKEGINDYTGWFSGDPDMEGTFRGYDGPGPPWNDSLVHRYYFTLYALDIPTLELTDDFTAAEVMEVIEGHVLDTAQLVGTYTLNPRLAG